MERLNTFLAKHLWLQVVLSALAATAAILLIDPGRSSVAVLLRVAVTSIGAVIVLIVLRRKEKRAAGGSATGLVSLDRKLRLGEVPTESAEREAMRELVEQRLHRSRHRVAATVFLVLLFGSVVALTATTSGLRQTLGFALFSVVFLGWSIANGNLQHRRLRAMRDELGGAPAESRAGTASAVSRD
ncbi:hypothetical protein [Streptomyces sp. NPDC058371]|uniref:hypothetical protein n=1 Tax=Streptomyces sp. NPDC058371 TaxID=3346463 RepID=UPI003648DE15